MISAAARRLVVGLLLFIATGGLIGWFYGRPILGLLAAAIIALAWHVRQILVFDEALRTYNFDQLSFGEGIWSQFSSRFNHLRERNKLHKKRYRQLFKEIRNSANALPDGGIVLNGDYEIMLCNKVAKELVGFRPRKDRGQRVDNILRNPGFTRYLRGEDFSEAIDVPSPVDEQHWLQCRIVPYGADQRLLLIRDITELRRLTQMRREFVANASHELRSPLTVISGYLDTVADDAQMPVQWKRPLEQMRIQAARMNRIVTELLELSRLEGAGVATQEELVDVAGLLAASKKSLSGRDSVPAIELDIQSRARIRGSASEVESVIGNLLTNAVRHTPADGKIVLGWHSDTGGGELTVADTGEGIAAEYLPRLTERFYRVDQGRTREDGGVGLGLAIVKHVLHRHDATLEVESALGEGSTFTCRFPADRVEPAGATPIVSGSQ
jgi:two-component system phosphate regulon sensor histidine kinase PhoR